MTVTINGTNKNHWHRLGTTCNPFPQLGKAEWTFFEHQIATLDGDPIKSAEDIRKRLTGFSPEFIEGCIRRWKPGYRIRFKITFPA
jgi:hypothetical protein